MVVSRLNLFPACLEWIVVFVVILNRIDRPIICVFGSDRRGVKLGRCFWIVRPGSVRPSVTVSVRRHWPVSVSFGHVWGSGSFDSWQWQVGGSLELRSWSNCRSCRSSWPRWKFTARIGWSISTAVSSSTSVHATIGISWIGSAIRTFRWSRTRSLSGWGRDDFLFN